MSDSKITKIMRTVEVFTTTDGSEFDNIESANEWQNIIDLKDRIYNNSIKLNANCSHLDYLINQGHSFIDSQKDALALACVIVEFCDNMKMNLVPYDDEK
jgi:hypothetical protein